METTMNQQNTVGSEMTSSEKAISLYQYIRGFTTLKQKIITDASKYPWACTISALPTDSQHLEIYYRDRVEADESETDRILLRVHKPEFQKCPAPETELLEWLNDGWDSYKNDIILRETIERTSVPDVIIERFDENEDRVRTYAIWKQLRDEWVKFQIYIVQYCKFMDIIRKFIIR